MEALRDLRFSIPGTLFVFTFVVGLASTHEGTALLNQLYADADKGGSAVIAVVVLVFGGLGGGMVIGQIGYLFLNWRVYIGRPSKATYSFLFPSEKGRNDRGAFLDFVCEVREDYQERPHRLAFADRRWNAFYTRLNSATALWYGLLLPTLAYHGLRLPDDVYPSRFWPAAVFVALLSAVLAWQALHDRIEVVEFERKVSDLEREAGDFWDPLWSVTVGMIVTLLVVTVVIQIARA